MVMPLRRPVPSNAIVDGSGVGAEGVLTAVENSEEQHPAHQYVTAR
jgi:hypothetical protein